MTFQHVFSSQQTPEQFCGFKTSCSLEFWIYMYINFVSVIISKGSCIVLYIFYSCQQMDVRLKGFHQDWAKNSMYTHSPVLDNYFTMRLEKRDLSNKLDDASMYTVLCPFYILFFLKKNDTSFLSKDGKALLILYNFLLRYS